MEINVDLTHDQFVKLVNYAKKREESWTQGHDRGDMGGTDHFCEHRITIVSVSEVKGMPPNYKGVQIHVDDNYRDKDKRARDIAGLMELL